MLEQLIPTPDVEEDPERLGLDPARLESESPARSEVDAGAVEIESRCRPFDLPDLLGKIAVCIGGVVAETQLEADPERLPHVLEALKISRSDAGAAAELERARRVVSHPELLEQTDRPFRRFETVVGSSRDRVIARDVEICERELASRRLPLEQLDRLVEER